MVKFEGKFLEMGFIFFIYCNVILNEIKDITKTNTIICLNKIAEKLLTFNENYKYSFFFDFILKYKLDNIGLISECNNPKAFDSITSIYKFLNKSNEFCLKYFLNRVCTSCSYSLKLEEFCGSYVPVTLEKFVD